MEAILEKGKDPAVKHDLPASHGSPKLCIGFSKHCLGVQMRRREEASKEA